MNRFEVYKRLRRLIIEKSLEKDVEFVSLLNDMCGRFLSPDERIDEMALQAEICDSCNHIVTGSNLLLQQQSLITILQAKLEQQTMYADGNSKIIDGLRIELTEIRTKLKRAEGALETTSKMDCEHISHCPKDNPKCGPCKARAYFASAPESQRPKIVCLCGSTRFKYEFVDAGLRETLAGKIVLTIGCNMRTDDEIFGKMSPEEFAETKIKLDELHKRKIDLADEVLILNVGGYIGDSTRSELEYAKAHGKVVRFLEPPERG
jgi:hypothetical protein